jgi:hypothetical protein
MFRKHSFLVRTAARLRGSSKGSVLAIGTELAVSDRSPGFWLGIIWSDNSAAQQHVSDPESRIGLLGKITIDYFSVCVP